MFAFASHSPARTVSALAGTVAAALICLGAAAGPAKATTLDQNADAVRTAEVSLAGVNLSSEKGRHALETRIRAAARSVCTTGGHNVKSRTDEMRCIRDAVSAAITPLRVAAR